MKKLPISLKTSIAMFVFAVVMTSVSVKAEDIEIYGIANANNPPVNVMFIFDMSGSMLDTPGGKKPSGSELSLKENSAPGSY